MWADASSSDSDQGTPGSPGGVENQTNLEDGKKKEQMQAAIQEIRKTFARVVALETGRPKATRTVPSTGPQMVEHLNPPATSCEPPQPVKFNTVEPNILDKPEYPRIPYQFKTVGESMEIEGAYLEIMENLWEDSLKTILRTWIKAFQRRSPAVEKRAADTGGELTKPGGRPEGREPDSVKEPGKLEKLSRLGLKFLKEPRFSTAALQKSTIGIKISMHSPMLLAIMYRIRNQEERLWRGEIDHDAQVKIPIFIYKNAVILAQLVGGKTVAPKLALEIPRKKKPQPKESVAPKIVSQPEKEKRQRKKRKTSGPNSPPVDDVDPSSQRQDQISPPVDVDPSSQRQDQISPPVDDVDPSSQRQDQISPPIDEINPSSRQQNHIPESGSEHFGAGIQQPEWPRYPVSTNGLQAEFDGTGANFHGGPSFTQPQPPPSTDDGHEAGFAGTGRIFYGRQSFPQPQLTPSTHDDGHEAGIAGTGSIFYKGPFYTPRYLQYRNPDPARVSDTWANGGARDGS
ncbi:hypothetical protein MMC07_007241 [Pseudocyphellaria aurata]|nr:hypothetical protein [Pseudocyphellaria aurata]